jgi:predicted dehydrogenase
MSSKEIIVGFIGAGGIARAHAFAINSLRYYYNNSPRIKLELVCSASEKNRLSFASNFGFNRPVSFDEFITNKEVNTVFILGPNNVHATHLLEVAEMPSVKRIYVEKPICSTLSEENQLAGIVKEHSEKKIQAGFQFLFMASVRSALKFWKSGKLGAPIHFDIRYYHGDYLKKEYRDKRATRLTPAPDGGAMADLGSHAISLAIAFFNEDLKITSASQSGYFEDVTPASDLYSAISLFDERTGAVGTLSASRVSAGTGDMLSLEIYAEKGTLRLSSQTADYFEYYLEDSGSWNRVITGSNYDPVTSFPSGHVPPGWLRSMIHAHYVFLTENNKEPFIPDLSHGLTVQRIVRETAEQLNVFRAKVLKKQN